MNRSQKEKQKTTPTHNSYVLVAKSKTEKKIH